MDYTDIKNTVIGLLMNVNDPDYRYFTEYWPKISHNKFIAFIKNGGIDLCGEHWDRVIYSDPMETIDFITMLTVENFGILYFEADPERIKLIAQNIKFFYFMCIVAHELYMNIKNNVYNIRGINLMNESAGVNLEVNTSFAGEIAHVFDLRYNRGGYNLTWGFTEKYQNELNKVNIALVAGGRTFSAATIFMESILKLPLKTIHELSNCFVSVKKLDEDLFAGDKTSFLDDLLEQIKNQERE